MVIIIIICNVYIVIPPGCDSIEWNSDDRDAKVGENDVNQQKMVVRLQLEDFYLLNTFL